MRRDAFETRLSAFLEHDWKAEALLQVGNDTVSIMRYFNEFF